MRKGDLWVGTEVALWVAFKFATGEERGVRE
jgi:hypothetical protein